MRRNQKFKSLVVGTKDCAFRELEKKINYAGRGGSTIPTWSQLANVLELPVGTIEEIAASMRRGDLTIEYAKQKVLQIWKDKKGEEATIFKFLDLLDENELVDLARSLLIDFWDRAIPDNAPWSFLNRQNYIARKLLQKRVYISEELIRIGDYLKTLSTEDQQKYKDGTLNGSIVKNILLSEEVVTLPCFNSACKIEDELNESDKLTWSGEDIIININSSPSNKHTIVKSIIEYIKENYVCLICIFGVVIVGTITIIIISKNSSETSSNIDYVDFKSTKLELIYVSSYEQYKSTLSDCERFNMISINMDFLNVSKWPHDLVPLCVDKTVALSSRGNLYTRTVFQLMSGYKKAQFVNISVIIIDSYEAKLEQMGNVLLPEMKHFVFHLRSPGKFFDTLFTNFSMPNLKEIEIQGVPMTDVDWANFQIFIGFCTTLRVVRLGAFLLSRTVFVKNNKLHSVNLLELNLEDLSGKNSFIEVDRSYICWAFPNLTSLYSQTWKMSLEVIKTCNSLETLSLTIQNDNGKVLANIDYFEYNHPALLYAEIYLTYSSAEKCPKPGITAGVSSKQFDTSLQIYSDKCEPNVLNIGGRVYEESLQSKS